MAVFLRPLAATELIDVGQHHSGPKQYPFKSLPFNRCHQTLNIDEEIPFYIMTSKNRNKYYLCRYQARIDDGENNDEEGPNCTVPRVGQVVHICQRQKNEFRKRRQKWTFAPRCPGRGGVMVTLVEANSGVSAGQPLVELGDNFGKLFLTICLVAWQIIYFNNK